MHVLEIHYEDIDWHQFPHGLADMANDIALKADKNSTAEQREHFKQQALKRIEADRLLMAQQVGLSIVGVAAYFLTPWGSWPVSGDAFDEDAINLLIAAGQGDPFVVHALASATIQITLRQVLQQTTVFRPLAKGEQPRRVTRAEVEAVVAEREAAVQAIKEQYVQREGPLCKMMIERQRKRQRKLAYLALRTLWKALSQHRQEPEKR